MQHEECLDPQASAQAFAHKLLDTGVNLDFSLRSLHVDIDPLLGSSLYCDRDSPSRWRDEASLAAHFKHPNYLNMHDALGRIGLKGADNKKYRVDLSEPVYDSTFTPRADFFTEGK